MNRIIRYAIDEGTGLVVSQIGSEVAWPVLDYEGMTPANNFKTEYNLEKMPVMRVPTSYWPMLTWTRKIPVALKNVHREFWEMKPLAI